MKNSKRAWRLQAAAMMAGAALAVSSCSDSPEEPSLPSAETMDLLIPPGNVGRTLHFEGYTLPLTISLEDPSWLEYETGADNDGIPTVRFFEKGETTGEHRSQQATVTDAEARTAVVTVSTGIVLHGGNAADPNPQFATDWENMQEAKLYIGMGLETHSLPWNDTYSEGDLPYDYRRDVKKEDGWEMAFSMLGTTKDANYFGLHNRYSGILRIFYFVGNNTTTASDYTLDVIMGMEGDRNKFPYLNALDYGVPVWHADGTAGVRQIADNEDLLGDNVHTTFETNLTPVHESRTKGLKLGWTAFDLDCSGYSPKSAPFANPQQVLSLQFKGYSTSIVEMTGSVVGGLSGSMQLPATATAAVPGGLSQAFKAMGTAGSIFSGASKIAELLCGKTAGAIVGAIGALCSMTTSVKDCTLDSQTVTKYAQGSLNLNLNADINIQGTINRDAAIPCMSVQLMTGAMKDSNFGRGVWGLAEDPVVYVASDLFLGDVNHLNLTCNGDGSYGITASYAAVDNIRMLTFMDPTSVKPLLNPAIKAKKVEVLASNFVAVPSLAAGHTSAYADALGLDRPVLRISDAPKGTVWRSTATNPVRYVRMYADECPAYTLDEQTSDLKRHSQAGTNIRYFGKATDVNGMSVVMNPQILLPVKYDENPKAPGEYLNGVLYDGRIPDLVASVVIRVTDTDNRVYVFSKRFVPRVIAKPYAELLAMRKGRLAAFCPQGGTKENIPVTLNVTAGGQTRDITYCAGTAALERAFRIMDNIK